MFIESLHVEGFKSLSDVKLTDLSAINVFHGRNDVGKSNLLEAIDLFCQILPLALYAEGGEISLIQADLEPYEADQLWRMQATPPRRIVWTVQLRPTKESRLVTIRLELREPGVRQPVEQEGTLPLTVTWPEGYPDETVLELLAQNAAGFNRLSANRFLQAEPISSEPLKARERARRPAVTASNLKRAILDAYLNLNLEMQAQYRHLVGLLDRFDLPGLAVAQSDADVNGQRYTIVGFVRGGPKIVPVEVLGSGVQQIVLLLGQMLLNPARTVGIEEPEMNLSPEWQARLMAVFRDLAASSPGGLDQIFITSHSTAFEFQDSFYLVTYHDQATQVARFPLSEREALFGPQHKSGEQRGQRINSQNQITLYQEVVKDLRLEYGDMVYFNKNAAGRWELYTEDEGLSELRELLNDADEHLT